MSYIDHLKYKEMADDLDYYLKNVKVVSFDIIHHECHGDKWKGSYKDYKTIRNEDFNNYT